MTDMDHNQFRYYLTVRKSKKAKQVYGVLRETEDRIITRTVWSEDPEEIGFSGVHDKTFVQHALASGHYDISKTWQPEPVPV